VRTEKELGKLERRKQETDQRNDITIVTWMSNVKSKKTLKHIDILI